MFDEKKRDTLKIMGGAAIATALPSLVNAGQVAAGNHNAAELANIDIQIRVSVTSNDLELVVRNTGNEATSITQLTPAKLQTARGHFNMQSITANGPVNLMPGENVTVPLSKSETGVDLGGVRHSLVQDLKDQVSIITDNEAFAAVSVSRMPYFV